MPETHYVAGTIRHDPATLAENFREVIQHLNVAELQVLLEVQAAEYVDRALPGGGALMNLRDLLDKYR